MNRVTGTYRVASTTGEAVRAFLPHPLPPRRPALRLSREHTRLHVQAVDALGKLDIAGRTVPSPGWFLYGFVRKEAVISSVIEGTQATLRDVAEFEATNQAVLPDDVEEVCNYVDALAHARRRLADPKGLPISTRLLRECHQRLMRGVRGGDKAPGELRRTQNWIGGKSPATARFVPPPPHEVAGAMAELERWVHGDDKLPPLVRAGLAHVQFETIHPFLDGNGRIGRLLITLLLEHWGLLRQPFLYLSLAFKRRQRDYYERLSAVRTAGDWEGWTGFFLECVREAADDGVDVAVRLAALVSADRARLAGSPRSSVATLRLLDALPQHPVVTVPRAAALLKVTAPTARKAVEVAAAAGVLREITGKRRDRVYAYHAYLDTLTGGEA